MARLAAAYQRGLRSSPTSLALSLKNSSELPLIAVGSGGALTLCELASLYHQRVFSYPAWKATPLALLNAGRSASRCAVLIVSARGSNPDILNALRTAVAADAKRVIVLCGRMASPLAGLAARYSQVEVVELQGQGQADGFLATGSLLSLGALLATGYTAASQLSEALPSTLDKLLTSFSGLRGLARTLAAGMDGIRERRYFIVLHAGTTSPAATDLESKFSEAGLGAVQVVDFRNFAHGRHFWLAKHANETAVISLEASDCKSLASQTLSLIGDRVPVLRVAFENDGLAEPLAAITAPILIAGYLGKHRGIDPGRPGVPVFGRRLYHFRQTPAISTHAENPWAHICVAVERKAKVSLSALKASGQLALWMSAHRRFVNRLSAARFGAIAFDYDGTLCEPRHRFDPLDNKVTSSLLKLLRAGLSIGVATGRGQSVRKSLRNAIPKPFWKRILVGYYNGGQIGSLSDEEVPLAISPTGDLASAEAALRANRTFAELTQLDARSCQITVSPKSTARLDTVWQLTMQALHTRGLEHLTTVRSGHSIDVLARGVSKINLVNALTEKHGPTLTIGDSGRWPGNDFTFLATPYGLSVDDVSDDLDSCWHLGPPGSRGTACCLYYCAAVKPNRRRGLFCLSLNAHSEL